MAHADYVEYRCVCGLDKLPGPYCPDCKNGNGVKEHIPVHPNIRPLIQPRQYSAEEMESFQKGFPKPFSLSAMIREFLHKNLAPGNGVAATTVVNQFWQQGELKLFDSYRHAAVRVRNVVAQMGWKTTNYGGRTFFLRPKDDITGYDPETRDAI